MNKPETLAELIARENAEAEAWVPTAKLQTKTPSASWKNLLYRTTKKNADKRGIDWDLTLDQFLSLIEQSGMKCTVTGIPLQTGNGGKVGRRPFFPSLDRIESHLGYSIGNCRIVCVAANLAMNQWGEDVLKQLAIGYFMHQGLERAIRKGLISEVLPDNVRPYRGRKGITYMARVRLKEGGERSLGSFKTPEEAAEAQEKWRANEGN